MTRAHRRRRRRGRRVLGRLILLVIVVLLASAGWVVVRSLAARTELTAAKADLYAARVALLDQRLDEAAGDITRAGRRTAKAERITGDVAFTAYGAIPYAGRSVRVVRRLTLAADAVANDVLPQALSQARALDPARIRRADGSIDVGRLQLAAPGLARLAAQTTRLRGDVDALPSGLVLGAVDRARSDFADQLDRLTDAARSAHGAVDLAPVLLGADRPRRYFVLVQQTSESRGTGGLPGGFVVLEARSGHLHVLAQGTDAQLRNGPVPVPPGVPKDYVDLYRSNGAFALWQNVNISPDLPVVARVVAARWKAQSGQSVDGVIALDALALADILRGSGPITIGGRQLRPEQLPDYLAVGQYADFPQLGAQSARKERLVDVARLASARVTRGGGSSADLAHGLVDAVRGGHLRMASDDPALRDQLQASSVDGGLPLGPEPVAYPVVFNSSGGKLDYFLDRAVRYSAAPCDGPRRRSAIAVTLRNTAPATGLPPYLTILTNRSRTTVSYDDVITLSVYGTRGAQFDSATLDGQPISLTPMRPDGPFLVEGTESGLPLWSVFLVVPRGKARNLVLHLDEPVVTGKARTPEQPLARPLGRSVHVPSC